MSVYHVRNTRRAGVARPGDDQYQQLLDEDLSPITIGVGEFIQQKVSIGWNLGSGAMVAALVLVEGSTLVTGSRGRERWGRFAGVSVSHRGDAAAVVAPWYLDAVYCAELAKTVGVSAGTVRRWGRDDVDRNRESFYVEGPSWLVLPDHQSGARWGGFVRVAWLDVGRFRFEMSHDGEAWTQVGADLAITLEPTYAGRFTQAWRGRSDARGECRLLERTTGAV